MVGRPGGDSKGRNGPFPLKSGFFLSTAQQQKFGTDLTISCRSGGEVVVGKTPPWGDPAVVGRPCCGGETPL